MTRWRHIEEEEFDRDWKAVRGRVFAKACVGRTESPFKDPAWRLVPMPYNPFRYLTPGSIRPDNYPPIDPYFEDDYVPLYLTLAEFGIDHMVLDSSLASRIGDGKQPRDRGRLIIFPDLETVRAVDEDWGFYPEICLYSREGSWGLVCDWDEIAMLGGTPEFIETFYRISGGEKAVRARFFYFQMEGGCPFPYGELFTPSFYRSRRPLVNMFRQAGWPWPNRWWLWEGEEIDWSWMMDDEGFPET